MAHEISKPTQRIVVQELTLTDGTTAQLYKATGRDVIKAQRISDGDQSLFTNAYMALTVQLNGRDVFPDELLDLSGEDYLTLMGEWSKINFSSTPKT